MNDLFFIAADYIKGNSIYRPVRRIFNLLFNISIASFIYEKIYEQYYWFDYYDYKSILDYFVKGNFFIPLSIFIAAYGITHIISLTTFYLITYSKTVKWTKSIIDYKVKKETVANKINEISAISKKVIPIELTETMLIEVYNHLKNKLTPENYNNIEKGLTEQKNELMANYHFIFRALITITIYFISLSTFGWLLYLLTTLTLLVTLYLLTLSYRLLDILPVLFSKFQAEAELYIVAHYNERNQKTEVIKTHKHTRRTIKVKK
ncbi:MAG: hypothetical protein A2509_01280 [Candidatus Edwardsbacteria bacterium RIFOXYD12_FULL_50_11]|uniref:Uncharacterized protein n=1 Tax=Candidatus Edwardsbacteria bacterium GWF2_54_11 TaxID=1817851 RepID=A0A1F5RCF5_9BACT|nr:MAG: hypothetical protein A2502_02610 [Candidatus Edwardsbacteria bacterium RifOxyC12_full_54_24]OGF07613.1 MAG: hypothetical protein A2273_03860 [Candidatus Edwardsbacteria bacterium RifOxyA12_full_54_48]OGF09864.1 MAG: hypothetical protein A3K15_10270 [Candidatus Edwardsbacteria bacterium GWE2_54_12]OGF12125.1 MAG: hypothetical protein A2024_03825 [Candidatus Edwardsbacteria bacterium GWF2_54_11]OGF16225.1 MAG: hypothetical protein A2509_01280 [Candidatus Edwardsbacteria bacterium RIFOXYD1